MRAHTSSPAFLSLSYCFSSTMTSVAAEFLKVCRESYPLCQVEELNGESVKKTMKLFQDLAKCSQLRTATLSVSAEDEVTVFAYLHLLMHHHEVRVLQEAQKLLPMLFVELHFEFQLVLTAFEGLLDLCISQIEKYRFRSETTRKTALGSVEDISLDSITGYVYFEQALFSLHLITFHALQHNPAVFQSFLSKSIDGIDLFRFLLETNVAHENRHINEQLMYCLQMWCYPPRPTLSEQLYHEYNYFSYENFAFMLNNVDCVALDRLDASLPAESKSRCAYNIVRALGHGLQDAFPQVRLAATKAFYHLVAYLKSKKVLGKLSLPEQVVRKESWTSLLHIQDCRPAMQEHRELTGTGDEATISLPDHLASCFPSIMLHRLLLNVFYPADSVQNVSVAIKSFLLGDGSGAPLYSYPCLLSSAQYYVNCTKHDNHNIVEAACYALCELFVTHHSEIVSTGDVQEALEGALSVFYASLTDQRWPVSDSAILTSAQLLFKYASYLPPPVFSAPISTQQSAGLSPWPQRFVTSYLASLRHGIPTVRVHALQALTLLLRHEAWEAEIGAALDQHVSSFLLKALQSTAVKTISSFLPPSMLEKYRSPSDSDAMRSETRLEGDAGPTKESKGTRGWDCCIDCQDLRTISAAEVSGGVLELCIVLFKKWGMQVYTTKRDLVIENDNIYRKLSPQFTSSSGPRYGKLHMCVLEALLLLLGDGLEDITGLALEDVQEFVYKQLADIVLQCLRTSDASNYGESIKDFLIRVCSTLARDVKKRQAELEAEAAVLSSSTGPVRRVVPSNANGGASMSRTNLSATTATIRKVRNAEALKKAFIFSTAKQVRDAVGDIALLGELMNAKV